MTALDPGVVRADMCRRRIMKSARALVSCVFALTAAACASSTAVPRPFPGGTVVSTPSAPDAPRDGTAAPSPFPGGIAPSLTAHRYDGRAVAEYALAFRGVPYRLGGADPAGFDCSGLVQYVFTKFGISVPRVVEDQWAVGNKIKSSAIRPGDLLFFSTKGRGASHVAIALDDTRFVHAPNSTGVVRIEALTSSYWAPRFLGARRVDRPVSSN